ncbi:MAG TPA: isoleucine--tRNA ligase, partial [Planctomycetota bacterium]|nr:isoleucine--tRNA ligase [Planctomycetota bacterium]
VLTRAMKDLWPRYKTMDGFSVARKAGWDTHGLPVEVEVEKVIGSKRKQDIEAYGVEKFVNACKESVWKYKGEWERMTERVGMWLDLERPYITYAPEYIDSVWWALQQLFQKGLLKKGYKILPWCPVCGTGLSNAEVGLGRETVKDPALTVAFKLKTDDAWVLAWTTTPWTLLSNVALVVGKDIEYGLYAAKDGRRYWLATGCAASYGKELGDAAPLAKKKGSELLGLRYEPLFTFATLQGDAHKIIAGDFVSTGDGTGIVHAAPAFGEDDYRVCKENGLAFVQLVKPDGTFTAECGKYAGKWIKDADPEIIRELKERKQVFKHDQVEHDYPLCWRTKNPLIYYARSAWFIETTREKGELVSLNKQIAWSPEHIRDGRMGQFLEENRDWNVSRERYWATPLPVWTCTDEKCGEMVAVSSRQDLVARGAIVGGKKVTDAASIEPHRPWVDAIELPCPKCGKRLQRDPSVVDCWFDSGAMPFAQWGYPHVPGSKELVARNHPADFICEAIDQTRGWFYTLHAISTLLFDKPAFKRCVVLGHTMVIDPETKKRKKESKSSKNYKPPNVLLDSYGADAVRWYFYSTMTPGESVLSPNEGDGAGVRDANRTFLHKILNVYGFFSEFAAGDGFDPRKTARVTLEKRAPLDRWILSERETVTERVRAGLDGYDFHAAAVALEGFVEGLSNWYLRRSRERGWSEDKSAGNADKWAFWWTLYEVLTTLSRLLAPFTPFMAEDLHRALETNLGLGEKSVHLERYPRPDASRIDRGLERSMGLAQTVAALGNRARVEAKINKRQPLRSLVVLLGSAEDAQAIRPTLELVKDEVNVKNIDLSTEFDKYVQFDVFPDWKAVGKKLGKRFRGKEGQEVLNAALRKAGPRAVAASVREGKTVTVDPGDGQGPVALEPSEVLVRLQAREGFTATEEHGVVAVLDPTIDEALKLEALVAELKSAVQTCRKSMRLPYDARIDLAWSPENETLATSVTAALDRHGDWLKQQTLTSGLRLLSKDEAGRLSALAGGTPSPGAPTVQWCDPGTDGRVLVAVWPAGERS